MSPCSRHILYGSSVALKQHLTVSPCSSLTAAELEAGEVESAEEETSLSVLEGMNHIKLETDMTSHPLVVELTWRCQVRLGGRGSSGTSARRGGRRGGARAGLTPREEGGKWGKRGGGGYQHQLTRDRA